MARSLRTASLHTQSNFQKDAREETANRRGPRPWPPPPGPTSPFPGSLPHHPSYLPATWNVGNGSQAPRVADPLPGSLTPPAPCCPVGGEGRGGSGVTGQPPVHVTWVAAPWCRRVTPPQNPAQTLTPALAVPPRGAARGPLPSVRKPRSLGKTVAHEPGGRTQSKGQGSSDSTRSQAAEAQCRPSPGLPPPASQASRAEPCPLASPLRCCLAPAHRQAARAPPGHPQARGPRTRWRHLPHQTPGHRASPHLDLDCRSEVWISMCPRSRALLAAWQLPWSVDGGPGAADHLTPTSRGAGRRRQGSPSCTCSRALSGPSRGQDGAWHIVPPWRE